MSRNIKKPLLSILVLPLLLQVSCAPTDVPAQGLQPSVSTSDQAQSEPVFDKVISKRTLEVSTTTLGSQNSPQSASLPGTDDISVVIPSAQPQPAASSYPGAFDDVSFPHAEPTSAPSISSDISVGYGGGYGYGSPGYAFYGFGAEFNNYIPITAEELTFTGSKELDLKTVYAEVVQDILNGWDINARLLESRGSTKPEDNEEYEYEYISVPGLADNSEIRFNARWVFRFSSNQRKETLNVYINNKETRVYRVIYGEPNIDISRVKVSVTEAQAIARKAFADRNNKQDFPIYPDAAYVSETGVIYDLPQDLNWRVSLAQQSDTLIYHLSFDYRNQQAEAIPSMPSASPSAMPSPQATGGPNSFEPEIMPTPAPDCYYGYADPNVYGSISIDAITGKIKEMNRPRDNSRSTYGCYGAYPDDIYPSNGPFVTPTPYPSATSDI